MLAARSSKAAAGGFSCERPENRRLDEQEDENEEEKMKKKIQ